jgi:hypothetical protein
MLAPTRFVQQTVSLPGSFQVISAQDELFNHVDTNDFMWSGDGARHVRVELTFDIPFAAPPAVTAALSGIDSSQSENLRFNIRCEDITADGFTLVFDTWDNTRIARACVAWTAQGIAPVRPRGSIAAKPKAPEGQ